VRHLLRVFRLKHGLMAPLGVHGVQWVEDRVVVRHPPGVPLGGSWLDCFADVRPVEAGKTHLMLPPRTPTSRGRAKRCWRCCTGRCSASESTVRASRCRQACAE
jgi:hypothetical protein